MLHLVASQSDVFKAWSAMREEQIQAERQMNADVRVTGMGRVVILCPTCSRPLLGNGSTETAFERLARHMQERHNGSAA